jgi:hypothetical protein
LTHPVCLTILPALSHRDAARRRTQRGGTWSLTRRSQKSGNAPTSSK